MNVTNSHIKRKAIVIVGYHYLSTPIYTALKEQLNDFQVKYLFTKDTYGSDTNFKYFDTKTLRSEDPDFTELPLTPPWHASRVAWHLLTKMDKIKLWAEWIWFFKKYKRALRDVIKRESPDVMIITTDLFFTPRYLAKVFGKIPIVLIQPCYLDLWPRPNRYTLLKRVINLVEPMVFETQQYFGMEIERAVLCVWDDDSYMIYEDFGRSATKIVNPTHIYLINNAQRYRQEGLGLLLPEIGLTSEKPLISFFTARYTEIHGIEYQRTLENALCQVIDSISDRFQVVIKIHPNEDLAYWKDVFCSLTRRDVVFVHNCNKFRLIASSEFMVSTNSYSAVEATLLGVVSVNFIPGVDEIGEEFCRPFSQNSAVITHSVDELVKLINSASSGSMLYAEEIETARSFIIKKNSEARFVDDIIRELVNH